MHFESFIPIRRSDLLKACDLELKDPRFTHFAEILQAYIHHRYHQRLESLKANFSAWDPDKDTQDIFATSATHAQIDESEARLEKDFINVLEQANYQPLTQQQLTEAFEESSVLSLDMSIDFNDFARWVVYWRGESQMPAPEHPSFLKRGWQKLRKKQAEPIDVFQRMVLLLRFKDAAYFEAQGRDLKQLPFTPGKMYLYLYKTIPRQDLEVLFPNVNIRMTWKDRLMFVLPALGAAVPMALKALPQILLLVGVILFFTLGAESVKRLGIQGQQVEQFIPVLLALLSLGIMFGGFAFKQYLNYKNKRLKFMKDVADTLFFKNLVCNGGVFNALVDAAEEEECKEVLLVIFALLQHPDGLNTEALDQYIEEWLSQYQIAVDFDVEKALRLLAGIKHEQGIVFQKNGCWHAQSLEMCCKILDQIWDNLYPYANTTNAVEPTSIES